MSVNKYRPHLWVIPEDEADQRLATGFTLASELDIRAVGITNPAGGWKHVLKVFADEYVNYLRRHPDAHVVLLLDFDNKDDRRSECEQEIPDDLKPRVFLIGVWDEPEALLADLGGTLEAIGQLAAENCLNDTGFWDHPQLAHNAAEVARMTPVLKPILFGP